MHVIDPGKNALKSFKHLLRRQANRRLPVKPDSGILELLHQIASRFGGVGERSAMKLQSHGDTRLAGLGPANGQILRDTGPKLRSGIGRTAIARPHAENGRGERCRRIEDFRKREVLIASPRTVIGSERGNFQAGAVGDLRNLGGRPEISMRHMDITAPLDPFQFGFDTKINNLPGRELTERDGDETGTGHGCDQTRTTD